MNFPTKAGGIVFVSRQCEDNCVLRLIGKHSFIRSRLQAPLRSAVFLIDLDLLQAEEVRPAMFSQEGSERAGRRRGVE